MNIKSQLDDATRVRTLSNYDIIIPFIFDDRTITFFITNRRSIGTMTTVNLFTIE